MPIMDGHDAISLDMWSFCYSSWGILYNEDAYQHLSTDSWLSYFSRHARIVNYGVFTGLLTLFVQQP
jgi:hypothetical protein